MRPGSVHYMAMPITEVIQVIVSFSNFTVTEPSVFASHTLHVSRWSPMSSMHNEIIRPSEVNWSEVKWSEVKWMDWWYLPAPVRWCIVIFTIYLKLGLISRRDDSVWLPMLSIHSLTYGDWLIVMAWKRECSEESAYLSGTVVSSIERRGDGLLR